MTTQVKHQLEKAQKELALLKAEYEEFVYIVSHDLSAPLRQVEGFVEIITAKHTDSFDDKTKRHFELINNGTAKAKSILDAMTCYSRINTVIEPYTLLDLNILFDDVKDNLSALIEKNNALLHFDSLPKVMGSKEHIIKVFECLIHNALTYQQAGNQPVINLSVIDKGNVWQFCIKDNGIGVANNNTDKIFKVLRRGVSDKKYAGMGMGLSISKKILQKHSGDIWLDTEFESGASFYFSIAKDLQND
jgi:light-regulated signal transduction histidine kinase (bacteriophytochrome)